MQQAQGAGAREVGRAAAPHLVITYQSFSVTLGTGERYVMAGRNRTSTLLIIIQSFERAC